MTYFNQNSFSYQTTDNIPYYQGLAIVEREKEVTNYLNYIADSTFSNQSQHDILVLMRSAIFNLRNVCIIKDANQNIFYDDNKFLEFVNRQLTAFKDRVLINYQHYLNHAPSLAPQYLEQNISILHELSHGQYSPIKQLNLEHQPIYSMDYFGQLQATFFSTQQQRNLETMMSYRPVIWRPAPPPVSLFSIAVSSKYHDPYNVSLPNKPAIKSQKPIENYFVKNELVADSSANNPNFLSGLDDYHLKADLVLKKNGNYLPLYGAERGKPPEIFDPNKPILMSSRPSPNVFNPQPKCSAKGSAMGENLM